MGSSAASEQHARWNGSAGEAWVRSQAALDRMFSGIEEFLVSAVDQTSSRHVLDVGCGTGAVARAVARLVAPVGGSCVGVDISQPMLAAAAERAAGEDLPVSFVRADAQDHPFTPARFDAVVSRFGVMFFSRPVDAFANILRATRAGGHLRVVAWRAPSDNPFMMVAERAAAPYLPDLPPRRPDAPGQFAFADADRVRAILGDAGWQHADVRPLDVDCTFPQPDLLPYLTRMGPLGSALQDEDAATRVEVLGAVRAAFDPFVDGAAVRFTAACWDISARAPAGT